MYIFLYSNIRVTERESQKERQKEIFHLLVYSLNGYKSLVGPGRAKSGTPVGSPVWAEGTQVI